ncbi:protein TonB [Pontibacter aydingkolensis]|uniref:TonB family protein n=1 Tax=Pontibacter aydingkolensis TaxID=1911536 RepID=A0ABS7CWU5_9BACT|nr:energy transducer TonB [Pontibacter aydingkolensis]MBW7468287.1 TonB family protein [Pontibacter aydingkolensis]
MEKSYYLSATFNEVIFADRNKGYGAYQLRRVYDRNVKFAVVCATILFAGALLTPLIKTKFFPAAAKENKPFERDLGTVVVLDNIPIPEKPNVEEQVAVAPKEKVRTEAYAAPKVVPNNADVPETELANQEDLKGAAFSSQKSDGVELATPNAVITDKVPNGLDAGTGEESNNNIFIYVEEMPEFNGGEKAMMNYIGKKINYPSSAQRENIQGLVVVTFVVAPNGEIRDAKVVKGLGYGTDEEALRVVSGMPKWKPGKQNGKPVSVRYTLPIRFSMR